MQRFSVLHLLLALGLVACGSTTSPPPTALVESPLETLHIEEVLIDTGPVRLAGTLLLPAAERPAPAAVLVPGSGPATRDGSWNMYRQIGEYLAGRGIAVLLYDKRGVGGSSGDWESETFEERAEDVAALLAYLRTRPEIEADQVGLIGHSQGAYIAPLVVAQYSTDISFVVLLAGSGQKVWDQVLTNQQAESLANGLAETETSQQQVELEGQLQLLRSAQAPCRALRAHYLCFVLDYDPQPALRQLTVPTLALYAALDTQVPPDVNSPLVESALQAAGNPDYTFMTFEQANHWFADAQTGSSREMRARMQLAGVDDYEFVPGFLETLETWVTSRVVR